MSRWALLPLLLAGSALAQAPDPRRNDTVLVAVTIDDLPWNGTADAPTRDDGNRRLLAALAVRRVPATGFVNCERFGGDTSVLRLWLRAGHELGNHTATHRPIDQPPREAWIADVTRCHDMLRGLTGSTPRHFRYPMLRQGATRGLRDWGASSLRSLGYTNASVTVDNSEYLIAAAYADVAAADTARKEALARLYVAHMRSMFRHAREVARRKMGRETAQVLLLHVNRLNADYVGRMLDTLAADGARYVPLATVLRDPLFSRDDLWVAAKGASWLYRIAPLDARDLAWDDAEADRVVRAIATIRQGR